MADKYVINIDTAKIEFERWAEEVGLLIDIEKVSEDDLAEVDRFIDAMRRGHLVISDEGEAVYTPQNAKTIHKDPITFRERSGATILAPRSKEGVGRGYAMMADVTGLSPKVFANMYGVDIKTCEAVFGLLMG